MVDEVKVEGLNKVLSSVAATAAALSLGVTFTACGPVQEQPQNSGGVTPVDVEVNERTKTPEVKPESSTETDSSESVFSKKKSVLIDYLEKCAKDATDENIRAGINLLIIDIEKDGKTEDDLKEKLNSYEELTGTGIKFVNAGDETIIEESKAVESDTEESTIAVETKPTEETSSSTNNESESTPATINININKPDFGYEGKIIKKLEESYKKTIERFEGKENFVLADFEYEEGKFVTVIKQDKMYYINLYDNNRKKIYIKVNSNDGAYEFVTNCESDLQEYDDKKYGEYIEYINKINPFLNNNFAIFITPEYFINDLYNQIISYYEVGLTYYDLENGVEFSTVGKKLSIPDNKDTISFGGNSKNITILSVDGNVINNSLNGHFKGFNSCQSGCLGGSGETKIPQVPQLDK